MKVFEVTDHRYGPHSVNLFPMWDSRLLDCFVAWKSDPSAIVVDAFPFPLKGENRYHIVLLLLSLHLHTSVPLRDALSTSRNKCGHSKFAGDTATKPRLAPRQASPLTVERLSAKHKLDTNELEFSILQDP